MESEKQQIILRHLGKLKRTGGKIIVEQLCKLARNGNCWFKEKRQWRAAGSKNINQVVQMLEKEPRGFEALICALLRGSKDTQTIGYGILEDELMSEKDIDGLLADVEGELSEFQEMKVTLIKEKKKNLKTSKELQKLKRNSLVSSSDQNTPEDSRLLSQYGRDVSTSIPDLLQELENEKRRREEAEKEAILQREKSERLEGEHLQTKKELDEIKRHSMAFSDLSDCSSYCEGELEIDQDVYPSSNEVGESISADMYDCDEGLWGKCRYGSIHSPPNEQVNEVETRAKVSSGQVVGTLVSKICELEDKLETEKAKQYISYSEITRLKLENEGLRRSMEDIVNTLDVEDSEFEVINAEENDSDSHRFIDECCEALQNTAFEPDSEQNTASPSSTYTADICPPAMSLQASGTWRSLNTLHYEFDDYDNVIEKQKNNVTDLKDALRELRHTTSFLKSRVQREGLELRVLRTKMKYS